MALPSMLGYVPAMIPTIKSIPRVAPKPISNEMLRQRTGDYLTHVVLSVASVIFIAEVILVWPR